MKNAIRKMAVAARKVACQLSGRSMQLVGAGVAVAGATLTCQAEATDLASTITTVSGYWTSVELVAIGILLFVVGRRIVKKI